MLQFVYIILMISVRALVSLCSHGKAWETIVSIQHWVRPCEPHSKPVARGRLWRISPGSRAGFGVRRDDNFLYGSVVALGYSRCRRSNMPEWCAPPCTQEDILYKWKYLNWWNMWLRNLVNGRSCSKLGINKLQREVNYFIWELTRFEPTYIWVIVIFVKWCYLQRYYNHLMLVC